MIDRQSLSNESLPQSSPELPGPHEQRGVGRRLRGSAQFLSFWLAIALPFVYLPLLFQGLGDLTVFSVFLSLVALNVVALYAGHGYNQ